MPNDDGLAPPPPPVPKAPPIPRGPDLEKGFVDEQLRGVVGGQDSFVGKLALAGTTQESGKPTFKPFTPNAAADGLRPVTSTLEKAVDIDSPEAAWARFMGTSVMNPFTSAVDQYQVHKIRDMQAKFYQDHGYTLNKLAEDLSHAKGSMKRLCDWLSKQHIPDNNIRGIMDKKAATGNKAMADLDNALANTTDPDDRAKLQAMKSDFTKWTQERDQRLKPEWDEEIALENRMDKLNREITYGQSDALQNAGMSEGPRTDTANGQVISSTQQQPQSLAHVQSLRDFMLAQRLNVVKTIRGLR